MTQTLTAKFQLVVDNLEDQAKLDETLVCYRDACNAISAEVFTSHLLDVQELQDLLYKDLRANFKLKSQMAISAIRTVVARYKAILKNQKRWIQPKFKKPQYNLVWGRDLSLTKGQFSISNVASNKRVKFNFYQKGMEKYFDSAVYKFGGATLVQKKGKYYLHISVSHEIEETKLADTVTIVGIDRGIRFAVATYDSSGKAGFVNGNFIKQKRVHYKNLRQELQSKHTPSARRRLKAMGHREKGWMHNVNHCISRALVDQYPEHTLFVIEDLKGIRAATELVRLKDRYVMVSWPYYDLEQKLIYKAAQRHSIVLKVNPRYTSQRCPICGHTERANRNHKLHLFTCKKCGYKSNDDRIGAMNLYQKGVAALHKALSKQ